MVQSLEGSMAQHTPASTSISPILEHSRITVTADIEDSRMAQLAEDITTDSIHLKRDKVLSQSRLQKGEKSNLLELSVG